jgi:hypothetical protein
MGASMIFIGADLRQWADAGDQGNSGAAFIFSHAPGISVNYGGEGKRVQHLFY